MAPSAIVEEAQQPPAKRLKTLKLSGCETTEIATTTIIDEIPLESAPDEEHQVDAHPLGIKPSGNALVADYNLRDTSTGQFAVLPDELLVQLLGYLSAEELKALGATSKGLYGFCRFDELWKALVVEASPNIEDINWCRTWRRTYLKLPEHAEAIIALPDLFSDTLYRPYQMSQLPLKPFVSKIPKRNEIQRFPSMTSVEFNEKYSNTPFVLTSTVTSWPGYKDNLWNLPTLASQYGSTRFRCESVDWKLRDYISYMRTTSDESPLYLFDRAFCEKTSMKREYAVPECFGQDYFSVLGNERPDHRWLILGPERSGSTFHKDPNATSAWNAVITGRKYWLLSPPSLPPPGVFESADHTEVTSPLSIFEWLIAFHAHARAQPHVIEGICEAGEVLHVPSGWWHLVVNLEASLAVTQNFVPRAHVGRVVRFLGEQKESVSGFKKEVEDPEGLFKNRLRENYPEVWEEVEREIEGRGKRSWGNVVKSEGSGFCFGFGGGDSDSE